jgi:hypothetical protein
MRRIIRILSISQLTVCVSWFIVERSYESGASALGALATLLATFIDDKSKTKPSKQTQSVTNHSTAMQAGGDLNINQMGDNKYAKK